MEGIVHEDIEILRMKQLLAQGFDDTDVADGTIKYIVPEDCLIGRNSEHVKKKSKKSLWQKWRKVFGYR